MSKILPRKFFERSTLAVARELLGKYLVRRCPSTSSGRRHKYVVAMITEVEAYDGPRDRASHASRGLTKRNAPMFGPAGHWYVYFTYGMHWMLNIVTREKGYPAAVLIRSVATDTDKRGFKNGLTRIINVDADSRGAERGLTRIVRNADKRGLKGGLTLIISGPAKVTNFFKIDKRFNGKSATRASGLWIEDRGVRIRKGLRWQSHRESTTKSGQIAKSKRIGVEYAGPIWAKKKWNLKIEIENGGS